MRMVPPALLRVELPSVARWCTVLPTSPVLYPSKYQVALSLLTATPLPKVRPWRIQRSPRSLRLLPMVTPSSVALLLTRAVPSLLSTVPPVMVPLRPVRPPVPNGPALPMFSVLPPLFSVPLRFTVLPAVRVKLGMPAVAKVPVRFNTPPLLHARLAPSVPPE